MRVSSPMPQFQIKTTNAKIEIRNEPLRLRVEREPARMKVHRVRPRMKVNWKQVRNQCGLKSPDAQRRYLQQKYRQMLLTGIESTNSEYEQIGDIQYHTSGGPDLVATVTLERLMKADIPVLDIASMPTSSPEVEWERGRLEIEWEPATLEMYWEGDIRPEITVTPHTVEIRLISGETIRVGENEARTLEQRGYGKRLDESV